MVTKKTNKKSRSGAEKPQVKPSAGAWLRISRRHQGIAVLVLGRAALKEVPQLLDHHGST